jgi:hypothetical protein
MRVRATKRKYEDLEQEHNALLELIDIAAVRSDARKILAAEDRPESRRCLGLAERGRHHILGACEEYSKDQTHASRSALTKYHST